MNETTTSRGTEHQAAPSDTAQPGVPPTATPPALAGAASAAPADAQPEALSEQLPDRLSVDPRSPHYNAAVFEREIGIRFNGKERSDVEEYCISERWIKVAAGKAKDRRGQPLMMTLKGKVEAFYR